MFDTLILAGLTALAGLGEVVLTITSHPIPDSLTTAFTALVGATAGVAYTGYKANGSANNGNATG